MKSNTLDKYINKDNWPTDLEQAKQFAIQSVGEWKWKKKADRFVELINKTTTIERLQFLTINAALSGSGDGVLKNQNSCN